MSKTNRIFNAIEVVPKPGAADRLNSLQHKSVNTPLATRKTEAHSHLTAIAKTIDLLPPAKVWSAVDEVKKVVDTETAPGLYRSKSEILGHVRARKQLKAAVSGLRQQVDAATDVEGVRSVFETVRTVRTNIDSLMDGRKSIRSLKMLPPESNME